MSQKWYCRLAGSVQGPFTIDVLKALLRSGQIDASTPVKAESSGVWIHLGDIVEMAPTAENSTVPGPPPPPPTRQGPPSVKAKGESREFPSLGGSPPLPSEVIPRRRPSKGSKDAQVWAWIGLIAALATVGALLALVLTGVISPQFGAVEDSKSNSSNKAVPEKVDPLPAEKETVPSKDVAVKDKDAAPSKEPEVTEKKTGTTRPSTNVAAKTPAVDPTADPLRGITQWYTSGMEVGRRGAHEKIRVTGVWFAWNDYGEQVDSFDMDDIEPKPAGSEVSDEESDSETEDDTPKRKRPRQKPEFLFVEVMVSKNPGGVGIEYQSWNGTVDKKFKARLFDDQGREIPAVPPSATKGVKRFDKVELAAGASLTDVLVFEVPKHRFERLRLALPLAAIGIEATSPYIGFEFPLASLGRDGVDEVGAKMSEAMEMEEEPPPRRPKSKRAEPEPESEPDSESE